MQSHLNLKLLEYDCFEVIKMYNEIGRDLLIIYTDPSKNIYFNWDIIVTVMKLIYIAII